MQGDRATSAQEQSRWQKGTPRGNEASGCRKKPHIEEKEIIIKIYNRDPEESQTQGKEKEKQMKRQRKWGRAEKLEKKKEERRGD